jgi:hypothetical protein
MRCSVLNRYELDKVKGLGPHSQSPQRVIEGRECESLEG